MSTCICGCGRPIYARGMADACWHRWRYHGCPESIPEPQGKGNDRHKGDRLEDYCWLRDEAQLGPGEAARRLGVSRRTVQRYDAALRGAT